MSTSSGYGWGLWERPLIRKSDASTITPRGRTDVYLRHCYRASKSEMQARVCSAWSLATWIPGEAGERRWVKNDDGLLYSIYTYCTAGAVIHLLPPPPLANDTGIKRRRHTTCRLPNIMLRTVKIY